MTLDSENSGDRIRCEIMEIKKESYRKRKVSLVCEEVAGTGGVDVLSLIVNPINQL